MSRIAYVNGRYLLHTHAAVHIEDRGYQFADGVYEVFAVYNKKLIGQKGHLDRLKYSLNELKINWSMSERALMHIVHEVMRRNHIHNGLIYLQITRGVAPRDHSFPAQIPPALVITGKKIKPVDKDILSRGVAVITIPDIRWKRRDIKSISLLPNVLGKQEAKIADAYEAWMIDDDGFITEGTSTNAWIVDQKGNIITRTASEKILNGITRLTVLEVSKSFGFKVLVRPFSLEEAINAREAFVTSSTSHVKAVTSINGKSVGNGHIGPVTQKLLNDFLNFLDENRDSVIEHPTPEHSSQISI